MRRKLFLFLTGCAALLYALPATASPNPSEGEDLKGRWEVSQITVEKNTDGKKETAVYKSASEMKSFIPFPQEWEIKDTETAVLRFPDGREETSLYTLAGKQFTMGITGALLLFSYSVTGENLTLTVTINYDTARSEKKIEHTVENLTVVLKKLTF
jgi:hypothetical protein